MCLLLLACLPACREAHPLGLPDVMVISTSSWNYVLKKTLQDLQDELEQLRKLVIAADARARKVGAGWAL